MITKQCLLLQLYQTTLERQRAEKHDYIDSIDAEEDDAFYTLKKVSPKGGFQNLLANISFICLYVLFLKTGFWQKMQEKQLAELDEWDKQMARKLQKQAELSDKELQRIMKIHRQNVANLAREYN